MGPQMSGACPAAGGPERRREGERSPKSPCASAHFKVGRHSVSRLSQGPGRNGGGQAEGAAGFNKTRTARRKGRCSALASEVFSKEMA